MTQKTIYTAIVSDHNLPNLLAILHSEPERVLLVVTPRFEKQAQRLKKQIERQLTFTEVTVLPHENLSGESMQEMVNWIKNVMQPLFKKHSKNRWVLNATGGTKIMPMALETARCWDEVHYKAMNDQLMQRWKFGSEGQRFILKSQALEEIKPLEALSLYTGFQEQHANRINAHSSAVTVAQQIWDAYDQQLTNYDCVLHVDLSVRLNEIWSHTNKHLEREVKIPWTNFKNSKTELIPWLQRLSELTDPTKEPVLHWDDSGVYAPGNKLNSSSLDKMRTDWKKWISGFWLETLIGHWFDEFHHEVGRSIAIDNQKRELDFVFLVKNALCLMEAKSAPPPNKPLGDIIQQIKSVTEVGKLKQYLFISPYFEKVPDNSPQKMQNFEENCRLNNINILRSRDDLYKILKP